jgi:hypothetical protein
MPTPAPEKYILDACCGGRMFWFNKQHPNAIYIDNRTAPKGHVSGNPGHTVNPDLIMDFRSMDFPDATFKLVVFDPPHFSFNGPGGYIGKKYGTLDKKTWREDLKAGFDECWRVLHDHGVLVFKWSEEPGKKRSIPVGDVISLFGRQPLFGHNTGSKSATHWLCFMKIPSDA